mgnify:CR=1 FL=1
MADLIEYTQSDFVHKNGGFRYILVVLDIFSKVAYTEALKKKDKFAVANGLQSIFQNINYYPNTIITDEGLEFYNKNVREVLEKYGIHHYSIKTKLKASIVERFNRTLKEKLEKYFYEKKTKRWVDVLQNMTQNYNNTPHRSIGMPPSAVNQKNAKAIFKRMFPDINLYTKPKLGIGDLVRILINKSIFDKGYKQRWSEDIYKIIRANSSAGRTWYKVADLSGNIIPGIKYYYQLNIVRHKK